MDDRWKTVDELNAEASRITDAAVEAHRNGKLTEDEAMAAIEAAFQIRQEAGRLRSQILADGIATVRAADPVHWL